MTIVYNGAEAKVSKAKKRIQGVAYTDKAQIELLCLANHVEAINGLLYMVGGGWTDHHRPPAQPGGQSAISHIGIAVMVRIPWNETNRPHRFLIEIQDLDGGSFMKVEGDLNIGRPPLLQPGTSQHACLAINAESMFARAGSYVLRGVINGDPQTLRTWEFRVHDIGSIPQLGAGGI